MAVFPRVQQQGRHGSRGGGRGTVSSSSSSVSAAKATTPLRTATAKQRASSGARSSPRLHLTQKRTPANARRGSGPVANQFASNQRQKSKAKGRTSSVGAHRAGSGARTTSRKATKTASAAAAAGGGARKKSSPADGVAKVMIDLKGDVTAIIDKAMEKVETECGTFVTTALESCSAGVSGREGDDETAAAAFLEMETRQASMATRRSDMLKEVESNGSSLSAVVERCRAALDSLQQAESRKLKSGLDRATGTKS
ncbi:unnamed protein product [Ectocarpus fasciculatus]